MLDPNVVFRAEAGKLTELVRPQINPRCAVDERGVASFTATGPSQPPCEPAAAASPGLDTPANPRESSARPLVRTFRVGLGPARRPRVEGEVSGVCVTDRLVAEHGGVLVAYPVPQRRRAGNPGPVDNRVFVELAGLKADRAQQQIAAAIASKEDILRAVIKEACQLAIDSATTTSESAATEARLQDFVAKNQRWARQRRPLALLFARELLAGDAHMKALIAEAAAPCVAKIAAIIHTGIERGEITPHAPPEALALTFLALTNMLLLQSWDGPTPWPPDATLPTAATALFLHGIAPPTG